MGGSGKNQGMEGDGILSDIALEHGGRPVSSILY